MKKKPNELQSQSLIELQLIRKQGKKKALVVLPSGVGKTHLSIFDMINNFHDGRLLFVTHRNELVSQTIDYFKEVLGEGVSIGAFNSRKKEGETKIVIATIQTLSRPKNLEHFKPNDFAYLVIDEFHHIATKTYQRVINYFEPDFMLGLTATPFRYDKQDILQYADNNIPFEVGLEEAIEKHFLVPFKYHGLWDDVDYSDIEWNGYRYKEKDLDKVLLIDRRDEAVIKQFKDKCGSKKTIGFCCSVNHVNRCVKKFQKAGVACAGITYKTEMDERGETIEDFKQGRIQIVFTRDIFNEGVDFPDVEALLFLRPTESGVLFAQQLGRGLRPSKGKKDVLVLDFIGNYKNAYMIKERLAGRQEIAEREIREKPVYKYPLGCEVHFDKEVVDLFEKQRELFLTGYQIGDKDLIKEYFRIKTQIGQRPSSMVFNNMSKYSLGTIATHFGSWNGFLKSIGEPVLHEYNINAEDLKNKYFRVKNELGHQPTSTEFFDHSKYSDIRAGNFFGSWNGFLKSIGEPVLHEYNINAEDLKNKYFRVKNELGHQPTSAEFSKHAKHSDGPVRRQLGSWNAFLKSIGEPILHEMHNIKAEDLKREYFQVKKELGHCPTSKEFDKLATFSLGAIVGHFGNWNKFIKSIGEPILFEWGIKREDLKTEYFRLKKELGHQPSRTEFDKIAKYSDNTIINRFGSWNDFLKFIGEPIIKKQKKYASHTNNLRAITVLRQKL